MDDKLVVSFGVDDMECRLANQLSTVSNLEPVQGNCGYVGSQPARISHADVEEAPEICE